MSKKALTAVLLGAGMRGADAYAPYALAHPEEIRFVAVAEPDPVRREKFARAHNIPPERQFVTWEEVTAKDQMADVLLNCTQDHMHYASGMAALALGYDILMEKPITNTLQETVRLVQAAEKNGRLMQICHVLRFTPFFSVLNEVIRSGELGELVSVEHRENVAFWHMTHSFVRGNWRNSGESSPMILAKCCHDLDILAWNFGMKVQRLQSFGSLYYYRPENAPEGALPRCTDGCRVECAWDARTWYLNGNEESFLVKSFSDDLTAAGRCRALETGPYGRCVYRCDNDVVDNQTVNMELPNGTTAVLFMQGHSHMEGRTMRYDGTRATLRGVFQFGHEAIEIHDHKSGRKRDVSIPLSESGHGGGDFGIMRSFVRAVRGEERALTSARESLESHLMAFAAEESRLNHAVIDMGVYREEAEKEGGEL